MINHLKPSTQFKAARILAALAVAGLAQQALAAAPAPNTLPTGGQVVAGTATIATTGNTMNVNQASQRAVVSWSSFDVGSNATVNFNQPNAQAATLNYVNSASKSMINGAVNANGQVVFVNNNGIVFGKGAQVNVGGMVATTMNTSAKEFMDGKGTQTYEGGTTGKVINKGNITGNNINSYIALMAPQVINTGVITATMGGNNAIALVAGKKVTLQFSGSQFVSVSVDASVVNALISNKLLINAGNGQVIIGANAAQNLMGSLIKNTGTISASDINTSGGKISLTADTIEQSGVIEANSAQAAGGDISLKGNNITLASGSKTTTTGATAGGNITIGVNNAGTQSVQNAINNNNLANTVSVQANAIIDASATQNGNGGTINIWSNLSTMIAGALSSKGGAQGGNGGFIETSSKSNVAILGTAIFDNSAPKGKSGQWTVDPITLIIDSAAATVITNALNTTNVTLDATVSNSSSCAFGACTNSQSPLIRIMAGADIYSANTATSLNLIATGGQIDINSNITAGQVYAVAQAINVNGSINTNGGSNSNIYLAGAIINILGNINSNGSNTGNNQNNSNSSNLNSANTTTGNNRRNGQNGLNADINTYTSNGGLINILATSDINISSNSYISSNGINGGVISIVSTTGKTTINGIVDSIGKGLNNAGNGGNVVIVGKTQTDIIAALISSEGLSQGGVINLGQVNNLSNGTILAPPATAPPVLSNFVNTAVASAADSNNSITSSNINIDSQTGINTPNGNIVVFGDQIEINNSRITAANGTIVIGREGYSSGALAYLTVVSNSTLIANRVETSGDLLGTENNIVKASEWLLDPTNITISAAASTGGSLATALAVTGVSNINTADIVAAVNAGGSVNVVGTGTITQSAALAFAPGTGITGTLTLDNRTSAAATMAIGANTTNAGAGTVNLVYLSSGLVNLNAITSTSGKINVTAQSSKQTAPSTNINLNGNITTRGGDIVFDGTGGTISGTTITRGANLSPFTSGKGGGIGFGNPSIITVNTTTDGGVVGANTTGGSLVVAISGTFFLTTSTLNIGGSISINTVGGNNGTGGGYAYFSDVSLSPVTAKGNINIVSNSLITNRNVWSQSAITSYSGSVTINSTDITSSGGTIYLSAPVSGYSGVNLTAVSAGASTNIPVYSAAGATISTTTGPVVINSTDNLAGNAQFAVSLLGSVSAPQILITANNVSTTGKGVNIQAPITITSNPGVSFATAAGDGLNITANVATLGITGGINLTAAATITNNSNGGNVTMVTNGDLNALGAVNFATANTTNHSQTVTYDTRTGNVNSQITTGAFTFNATGATQRVNFVEVSNGSKLTIDATSVSGYILIDNTCPSCTTVLTPASTATLMTTSAAITVSGALSAGDYISLNGLNNSATLAAVVLGTSTLTVTSASTATTAISVIGNHNTANIGNPGITSTGAITDNANGGGILFKSNGAISQTGAVTVAANTSGTASSITYDTTTGNLNSSITSGALTLTGGVSASNTAINYIQKASGAPIAVSAVSMPGYILLDNTYGCIGSACTPVSGFINQTNLATLATKTLAGVSLNGTLSSGLYAGPQAITINGITAAPSSITYPNGVNGLAAASLSATTGDINITGQSAFSGGISMRAGMTASSGNINIFGVETGYSALTAGDHGVSWSGTGSMTATGNITISGSILSASNTGSGVNMAGNAVIPMISAGGNLAINGYNSSTSTTLAGNGIYLGGAATLYLKSGGNTTLSATNLSTNGSTYGMQLARLATNVGGNLTLQGATLSSVINSSGAVITNVATEAPGTSASGATGIAVLLAPSSVTDGTQTIRGITAVGNVSISARGTVLSGYTDTGNTITTQNGNVSITASATSAGQVAILNNTGAVINSGGSVSLTGTSTTGNSITNVAAITAVTGVTITGTGNLGVSAGTAGAISNTALITNTGAGGVTVTSTGNTSVGAITDSGSGGISITGGRSVAAGTTTNGTITGVGTLTNTGGGVISLSMAQPTSVTGGVIESAAGITTTNASTSSNVSYGNIGGVMGAVNAATVNSVNYRSLAQGISVTLKASYTQPYGTAYNSTLATDWLRNPAYANVTVSGSANFGSPVITAAQAQASLIFASTIGGNSNLVQTITNLDGTTSILSSLGRTVTTAGAGNTYTITPKALTITGTQLSSTYNGVSTYETVANAGYTISGLVTNFNTGTVAAPVTGAATGDTVSGVTHVVKLGASTMTNSAVAQACSTANCYTDAVSAALGTGLSNYTITYVSGTFNIAKAALSITQENTNLQFTGSAQTVTPAYSVSGLVGLDAVSSLTTNSQTGTANGTYTGTISGANGVGLSNYTITYNPGTLTITSNAVITITALTDTKVYGNSVTAGGLTYSSTGVATFINGVGYTISGLTAGDTLTGLVLTSPGGISSAPVGSNYVITPSGATIAGTGPYSLNYVTALMTVTPRPITIAATPITTTYGTPATVSQSITTGYTVSSGTVAAGDTISTVAVNYNNGTTNSTTVPGTRGAATYAGAIVPSAATGTGGFNASNYTITYTPANLVVNPLAVTITANAQSTTYGTALPLGTTAYTSSLSSLPNGDTISSVSLKYNSESTVPGTTNAATYTNGIVASGASGTGGFNTTNYAISYAPGTLTVNAANVVITPVNLSASGQSVVYNGATQTFNPATGFTVTGLQNGQTPVFGTTGLASGLNVGTYANNITSAIIASLSSGSLSNYNITVGSQGSLTITPASLTVTGATTSLAYNGASQSNASPSVVGLVGIDLVSGNGVTVSGKSSGTNAGTYNDALAVSAAGATQLSNYSITKTNGALTITRLAATIAGATTVNAYTSALQTNTYATSGILVGDLASASAISIGGVATATHVSQGTVPDVFAVTGTAANNYNFTYVPGSITLTPVALSVTGANTTAVYNKTTQTNSVATVTGLKGSDAATIGGSYGSGINVGVYTDALSVSLSNPSDYTVGVTNGSHTITPAIITVNGITAQNKVYDATSTATLNVGTITTSGVIAGDTVILNTSTLSGAFSDKNVGNTKTVLISGVVLAGASSSNYQLSGGANTTTTANITPAPLSITGSSLITAYNGSTQSLVAPAVTGLIAGDNVIASGNATGTNAGTYTATYTATGVDAGNYTITSNAPVLTINKASLVVTANNAAKIYGQTDPTLTATISGLQGSDTSTVIDPAYTLTRATGDNAGTYAITAAGPSTVTNYNITYAPASFTIAQAGSLLISMNAVTTTYGTAGTPTIASIQGEIGGVFRTFTTAGGNIYTDGVGTTITITPSITGATVNSNVGAYANSVNGAVTAGSTANYTAVTTIANTLNITPAPLALTVANLSKTYDANPVTTAQITGVTVTGGALMNSQTIADLGGLTYSGSSIGAINASGTTYPINGSVGSGFSNYNVTITNGALTINQAPLVINGAVTTTPYSGVAQTNAAATVSGLQGSDSVVVSGYATATHVSQGIVPDVLVASGASASNYSITYNNGSIAITPASLLVTGVANQYAYNGALQTNTGASVSGLKGTDTAAVAGYATATHVSQGIVPDALVATLSKPADYTVTYVQGSLQITPIVITAVVNSATVMYNAESQTAGFVVTGLKGADTATAASGTATGTNVGTYTSNLVLTTSSDYTVGRIINGTLNITPAPLTISAGLTANNKVYDTTTAATIAVTGNQVLAGVLGVDAVTVASTGPYTGATFSQSNVDSGLIVTPGTTSTVINGVTYTIMAGVTLTGAAAGNYYVAGVGPQTLTANITPKPITIATGLTASDKVYDGTTAATITSATQTLSGVLPSDIANVSVSSSGPYAGTFSQSNVGSNLTVTPTSTATTIAGASYDAMTGVTLSGSAAGNYYVTGTTTPIAAAITPYIINFGAGGSGPNITAVANNKVYTSTTSAYGTLAMVNLFGTDSVDVTFTSASFANPNVANSIPVTFSGVTLSGASAGNYAIGNTPITSSANITPAPLTITAIDKASFYTQATADLTQAYAPAVGLLGSDTVTGATITTTATNTSAVDTYPISISTATGTGLSNYAITYVPATYTIVGPGGLLIATSGVTTPYGTGTSGNILAPALPTATYTTGGTNISPLIYVSSSTTGNVTSYVFKDAANVTVTFDLTPSNTSTSGSGNINIGSYPYATSNLSAGTTGLTSAIPSGNFTVTPLAITITAAPETYAYNGSLQTQVTATSSPAIKTNDLVAVTGAATGKNVGVYGSNLSATGSGSDIANYNITYVNADLTITPYILGSGGAGTPAITATANNKVYDTTTVATGNLAMANPFAGDIVAVNYANANFATPNVANGLTVTFGGVTLSGPDAANYAVGSAPITATANITPAPLTISAGLTANNKVYDTTTAATITATGTQTLSGILGSDAANLAVSSSGPYTGTFSQAGAANNLVVAPLTSATLINSLSYNTMDGVTLSGSAAGNYYVTGPTTALTANITKAPLTITANNQASFVTLNTAALSYSQIGLLPGDVIASVGLTTTASSSQPAGSYAITAASATGAAMANYQITYNPGNYTIVPAGQVLIATTGAITNYGTPATFASPVVSYMVSSSGPVISNLYLTGSSTTAGVTTYTYADSSGATIRFNFAPTNPAISGSNNVNVGIYGLTAANFVKTGNNITSTSAVVTGDLTVNPLPVIVTATPTTYMYNGTIRAQAYTAPAIFTNDNVLISGTATGKNVGSYSSVLAASGTDAANYDFTYVNAALVITPYIINYGAGGTGPGIRASANNKVYNTNNVATGSLTMVNLFAGDVVNANFGSANFGTSNVVTSGVVTFNSVALSGPDALNYSIGATAVTATANITPAPVTISGLVAANKQYDGNTVAVVTGTPSIAGLLGSDTSTLTGSVLSGTFASSNPATGLGVTANLTSLLLGNSNYYIAGVTLPLTADIIAPPQTINNMAIVQQQVAQEFVQDRPTDRIKKGELIYVRDKDNLPEYLQAIEVPSTGAFKFPVPDSIIQDLINLLGENAALAKQAGSYRLLLLPQGSRLVVTLPDGSPLPSGIKYDAGSKNFTVPKLGNVTLPLSVKVTLMRGNNVLSDKIMVVTK